MVEERVVRAMEVEEWLIAFYSLWVITNCGSHYISTFPTIIILGS